MIQSDNTTQYSSACLQSNMDSDTLQAALVTLRLMELLSNSKTAFN